MDNGDAASKAVPPFMSVSYSKIAALPNTERSLASFAKHKRN